MKVTAEVRDLKKLNKMIKGIIITFTLYMLLTVGSIIGAAYCKGVFTVLALVFIVLLIPSIIIAFVVASKGYNNSWMLEDYELTAQNNAIYCNGKRLHVNYNELTDVIYVHDLGDYDNPSEASIYLTVFDEDKNRLMDYIRENGIRIEEERVVPGRGKYGSITSMDLNVNRYRRR